MAGITGLKKAAVGLGTKLEANKEAWKSGIRNIIGSATDTGEDIVMNGTFIGMDYSKVPVIRQAIRDYVAGIQKKLDELNTEANAGDAFKGEIQTATKAFVVSVSEAAKIYTSQLLEFSDAMQYAHDYYVAHDSDLSSQVNEQATNLTSKLETYTEKR